MSLPNLADLVQTGRPLQAKTPLADHVLIPTRMVGTEGVSRPFNFVVDFVSTKGDIAAKDMLGKPISLTVIGPKDKDRHIHGLVARWSVLGVTGQAKLTRYTAELVPWFWLLGLSSECRTFEQKSVKDILSLVFKGAGFSDFRFRLTASPQPLAYVVQYEESDLAFASRMLEDHGLYYAFEHTASKHTLVVSDSVGGLIPEGIQKELEFNTTLEIPNIPNLPNIPGLPNLPNIPGGSPGKAAGKAAGTAVGGLVGSLLGPLGTIPGGLLGGVVGNLVEDLIDSIFGAAGLKPPENAVTQIVREHAVHTKMIQARDFQLLRPTDSAASASGDSTAVGKVFRFLGDEAPATSDDDVLTATGQWLAAEERSRDVVRGGSTATTLAPNTRVKIKGGPMGKAGEEVHVLEVAHVAEVGDVIAGGGHDLKYVNEFVAIPVGTQYRPDRVTEKPSVRGTQTALVVGSGKEGEIDVDEHGRMLLQFPWDRGDGKEGKSAHRVHLASFWAGAGWGAIHLPRISQRVLVEFLEGDPDRPIITGRVYSNQHPHPYTLPANKTQSGIKSRSVGEGAAAENFNEIRFEDKKGEEHVSVQAEKDLQTLVKHDETRDVKHDRTTTITNDDTRTVSEGNDAHTVSKGNQTVTVESGNQTVTVSKGNQKVAVTQGNQTVSVGGGRSISVGGDQKLDVKGKRTTTIQQDDSLTVSMGDLKIDVSMGKISVSAMQEIEFKCGASTISMKMDGTIKIDGVQLALQGMAKVDIGGAMVNIGAQGMAKLDSPMTQVNGSGLLMAKGGVTMIN